MSDSGIKTSRRWMGSSARALMAAALVGVGVWVLWTPDVMDRLHLSENPTRSLLDTLGSGIGKWTPAMVQTLEVNKRDGSGMTALMWASLDGDRDLVERLLKAGSDATLVSEDGLTALGCAAQQGRIEAMRALLERDRNVNQVTTAGTALLRAASNGQVQAVRLLLRCGAKTELRDAKGRTPLLAAIGPENDAAVVNLLLAAGADPSARDGQGNTALHWAQEEKNEAIIAMLTKAIALQNERTETVSTVGEGLEVRSARSDLFEETQEELQDWP